MFKRFIAVLVTIVMVVGLVPSVTVAVVEEIRAYLSNKVVTDENLVEMVADGTIPYNVTELS